MKKLFLSLLIVFMMPAVQAMEPGTGDIPGGKERTFNQIVELPPEVKFEIALALVPKSIKTPQELSKVFADLLKFGMANTEHLEIIKDPNFLKQLERRLLGAIESENVLNDVPNAGKINAFFRVPDSWDKVGSKKIDTLLNHIEAIITEVKIGVKIRPEKLKYWLDYGVNPNIEVKEIGDIYVPIITMARSPETVDILLHYGADINKPTPRGETLLFLIIHQALFHSIKNLIFANYLLIRGADPTISYKEDAPALLEALTEDNHDKINAIQQRADERIYLP